MTGRVAIFCDWTGCTGYWLSSGSVTIQRRYAEQAGWSYDRNRQAADICPRHSSVEPKRDPS